RCWPFRRGTMRSTAASTSWDGATSLAGFQVSTTGRFWVSTEGSRPGDAERFFYRGPARRHPVPDRGLVPLLRAFGRTLQRPAKRAKERNETAIRHWVTTRWPAVKKTLGVAGPGSLGGHPKPASRGHLKTGQ